ncbi:hypothetical protein ACH4F6_31405 [Streptomyces sp. NPDC017936]|uniref:hypothetical protein n=1 Tax=Streptomyces sp. NPDC017936 TaxID=3365016 RepID=UPI003795C595
MNVSTRPIGEALAAAVREQAMQAGADTPAVRGSDWRMAVVATVNADGTIVTTDGVTARRDESYISPAPADLIVISQSSNGQWWAWGRGSTGGVAIGEVVAVRKPSSTSRASTATVSADPHLTMTLSPGTYLLDALLMYDGDAAADLKLGWIAPAGTTGAWWPGGADSSVAALASTPRWGALSDITTSTIPVGAVGAGTIMACRPVGTVIITTAGAFALAWAQNSGSATPTILRGQSTLQMRRIA